MISFLKGDRVTNFRAGASYQKSQIENESGSHAGRSWVFRKDFEEPFESLSSHTTAEGRVMRNMWTSLVVVFLANESSHWIFQKLRPLGNGLMFIFAKKFWR